MADVTCPFCGEGKFDLPGLKMHLERGWCEPYDVINTERESIFSTHSKVLHAK